MPVTDIGWAIQRIKNSSCVRRPHWGAGFYVFRVLTQVPALEGPFGVEALYIVMPSLNRVQPFTCHHDDLLATDWELAQ